MELGELEIRENGAYINIGNIFNQNKCDFCHAQRWLLESKTNCCSGGKVLKSVGPYKEPPAVLCELLQNKDFCKHIKEYNNSLAFGNREGPRNWSKFQNTWQTAS